MEILQAWIEDEESVEQKVTDENKRERKTGDRDRVVSPRKGRSATVTSCVRKHSVVKAVNTEGRKRVPVMIRRNCGESCTRARVNVREENPN